MNYYVRAYSLEKVNLTPGKVEEILQNIAVIISTPKQNIPMDRGLGINMDFIDKPMPVAQAMLAAEINEAIADQEPRANVSNITFEIDENVPGKLIPTVEVEIEDE